MKTLITIIFVLGLLPQSLLGWGRTGHRIVGKVAETYLTKNAKTQIKKLMGHHDLSRMSNWADEIKSDPDWQHANDWHWCTVPDGEDYEMGKHKGLAAEKVKEFINTLKNFPPAAGYRKKVVFTWFSYSLTSKICDLKLLMRRKFYA